MMKLFLLSYAVKGIKSIDKKTSLSFYNKTIKKDVDLQKYNMKGIYGMNGSGKSGIISSINVLKNLLMNSNYLNNPIVQEQLNSLIHKKLKELTLEVEFILKKEEKNVVFKYEIVLSKNSGGKYTIKLERFSEKKGTKDIYKTIYEVENGLISHLSLEEKLKELAYHKTMNLLDTSTLCVLFLERLIPLEVSLDTNDYFSIIVLYLFACNIHVYLENSDKHSIYCVKQSLKSESNEDNLNTLLTRLSAMDCDDINVLVCGELVVPKDIFEDFQKTIDQLFQFLKIFKSDLEGIEIEKKEERNHYVCSLVMIYDEYKVAAEYESTGVKKLVKLYTYLLEMVQGGIVFIDELDANIHDVYLCALLEYLMEYGKGQLCFTSHNIGPMDILRHNKKSIDFLSMDHNIYPWIKSGNYSPAMLYRNGMIEGSPFNVDAIDFIGVLGKNTSEE